MRLEVDALLETAVTKAKSDAFGDMWFLEPLGVLVESLNNEAQLNELGFQMTERRLTALLVDRLRLRQYQADHPAVKDEEVQLAAEICGLPRTGSTLLHRLLAASPQLTSTASWECSYPLPFPGETDGEIRKGKAQKMMEMFLELSPDFADIHTVSWDQPEEDILLLDRTFTDMGWDSFYWVPTYGVWLRSYDQSKAYAELRQWLQALQHQNPARRGRLWVGKSPHHLTAVDTVLDTFPGSKIVMTHRTPTSAVPSYASMVAEMSARYSEAIDKPAIGRYWSERFVEALTRLADSHARRPDRFVDVPFKATVAEPLETVQRVMDGLGLTVGAADLAAFEAYLARNKEERHGSHSYTAEDFGLSTEQLEHDFRFYTEENL
ncbi:MAG TPA: sulfotransferase [Mycobacteriales bacterium]|nr:sulfotransferase [Mycobacteriales bacterium]